MFNEFLNILQICGEKNYLKRKRRLPLVSEVKIVEIKSVEEHINEFTQLLIDVVETGASIGFLPPLSVTDARDYWENVLSPGVILLVALKDNHIVGTIQLHLCQKQNGRHRAEIAKLLTAPNYRRMGIARALLQEAEKRAETEGRFLLVLDTREGDPANLLYKSLELYRGGENSVLRRR
jgi:ribosomal protein S18 acetylase RimI-like enzyme